MLKIYLSEGYTLRKISLVIGKNVSSLSREIKRNSYRNGNYDVSAAQRKYRKRRKRCVRKPRLEEDSVLKEYVISCLSKYWSPELTALCWNKQNPDNRISHTTIYRALRKKRLGDLRAKTHLMFRDKKRKMAENTRFKPEHVISEREEYIQSRERIGDWEMDTVVGKLNQSYLFAAIDRKSRYLVASTSLRRKADVMNEAIFRALDGHKVKSITADNGVEFAHYKAIQQRYGIKVYFADKHSHWKRGTSENINRYIRFFFPKGTDFSKVDEKDIRFVVELLNDKPRKCLSLKSPKQVFFDLCCT